MLYWPMVALPGVLGGARPWLWSMVGAIFALVFAVFLWTRPGFRVRIDAKTLFVLLPVALYPLLQAIPLPLSIVSALSPHRAGWVLKAREAVGEPNGWASLSYAPLDTLFSALWLLMLLLYALLLRDALRKGGPEPGRFFTVLFVVAGLEALYGFFQALVPSIGGQGVYAGCATGTFANRNHYAAFLAMIFPLQLAFLLALPFKKARNPNFHAARASQGEIREKQIFFGFLTGLLLMGILLSRSRGGIIGALIGMTVLACFMGGRARAMIALVADCWAIALVYGWMIGFREIFDRFARLGEEAAGRLQVWSFAWHMIREHPLTGTGLGTFAPVALLYQVFDTDKLQVGDAHSDYLQIAAELGLPLGIAVFLLAWGYWWKTAIGLARKNPRDARGEAEKTEERIIRAGALAGSAAFFCHAWVEFAWQIPANQLCLVTLLALMRYHAPAATAPQCQTLPK